VASQNPNVRPLPHHPPSPLFHVPSHPVLILQRHSCANAGVTASLVCHPASSCVAETPVKPCRSRHAKSYANAPHVRSVRRRPTCRVVSPHAPSTRSVQRMKVTWPNRVSYAVAHNAIVAHFPPNDMLRHDHYVVILCATNPSHFVQHRLLLLFLLFLLLPLVFFVSPFLPLLQTSRTKAART
jgi:hypothetical protein